MPKGMTLFIQFLLRFQARTDLCVRSEGWQKGKPGRCGDMHRSLPESSEKDPAPDYLARTSEFLQSWRTPDIEIGRIKPSGSRDSFIAPQPDGDKRRCGIRRLGGWAGAVRRHADQAGSGIGRVRVIVGRLRRNRPQHQGQAQPGRPSDPKTHRFPASGLDC